LNYDVDKFKSVIDLVSSMSGWGKTLPGIYRGITAWFSFNTYVAQVVDLTLEAGKPRVKKVYCAVNCGKVVNPAGAENQVEGAIIDGLGHALYSKATFNKGSMMETNFHLYKFYRMKDTPIDIEVKFVESDDAPTGLGEPGLPPIAPALANAIFAATGKRLRKMPFNV
jgi:isoquinoline 1-oxidoreductase beta subunit